MLILIAESKTMSEEQQPVSAEFLKTREPAGEGRAEQIMDNLEKLSQPELIAETGLSASLAARLRQMIYEFPNKTLGRKAIEAYTGVVFKALDYDTLDARAQSMCDSDVRIISSLYGILRPGDIIKPYRLDFTAKAAPDGAMLCSFWKKDATVQLVRTIQDEGFGEILNLLPADAAKCIDWKIVKRFCKVWKVDFVEMAEDGRAKTPSANRLKTMRGKLLRHILCEGISCVASLKTVTSDDFICEGTPVYPDHLRFIC